MLEAFEGHFGVASCEKLEAWVYNLISDQKATETAVENLPWKRARTDSSCTFPWTTFLQVVQLPSFLPCHLS